MSDYDNYPRNGGLTPAEQLAAKVFIWEIESVDEEDYVEMILEYAEENDIVLPDGSVDDVVEAMNRMTFRFDVDFLAPEVEL